MKVINRVIFGLIVAVGLMLVATITNEYYRSREIIKITEETLENKDYTDLISAAYYNETPVFEEVITKDNKEFLVLIYEAAHITKSNDELIVLDGFQLLMIQNSGEMLPEYFDVVVHADQDIKVNYTGFNLYNLGLYSSFNADTQGSLILENYFLKDDEFQTINKIEFIKEEELIFELELSLTSDMLTISEPLETYLDLNSEGPSDDIEGVNYNDPIQIDVRNQVIRNVSIYLVVIIIIYYLVFIRKPKTLGKDQATEGLTKDIERLKNDKKSDL